MSMKTDLVVIGAGPAGIMASSAASGSGMKVVLIDNHPQPGGQYYRQLPQDFSSEFVSELQKEGMAFMDGANFEHVSQFSDTMVWGVFPVEDSDGWLLNLYGPDTPSQIETKAVILASGAYDRPIPFPGWDLPGVMTAGAAQILVKSQRVSRGQRVLVAGSGPLHLSLAAQLVHAGVEVVGFYHTPISLRDAIRHIPAVWGQWKRIKEGLGYWRTLSKARVPFKIGWGVVKASGTEEVEEVLVGKLDAAWNVIQGTEESHKVDTLIVWNGLLCNNGLSRMVGCDYSIDPEMGGVIPKRDETMQTSCPNFYVVGDAATIGGAELAKLEGQIAGTAAAWRGGRLTETEMRAVIAPLKPSLDRERRFARMLGDLFAPRAGLLNLTTEDTVICRCEEVTLGAIRDAVARGARSAADVKMITRCGMGNCQGRMCELRMAQTVLALLNDPDLSLENVGSFTTRPPLYPLPVAVLSESLMDERGGAS